MRALRGQNIYAFMPVLHIVMDISAYNEYASSDFPGFTERLTAWLPGLEKHECKLGRPGGFTERLKRGTYLPYSQKTSSIQFSIPHSSELVVRIAFFLLGRTHANALVCGNASLRNIVGMVAVGKEVSSG